VKHPIPLASSAENSCGQIHMLHPVSGGLMALPAKFGCVYRVGKERAISPQGIEHIQGRYMGAVRHTSLAREFTQGCGQGCHV